MSTNNNSKWVICFGYPWSNKQVYSIGNIINQFYNSGKKILWINPIPNRNLKLEGGKGDKSLLFKRIWVKLKQQLKIIYKHNRNFYVVSPLYIPFVENKIIYRINKYLIYTQVKIIYKILNISKPIICSSGTNDNVRLIKSFNYSVWYHSIGDLFHDLRGVSEKTSKFLYHLESKIFNNADVLIVASYVMVEKVKKMVLNHDKIYYFPHGSDFNHFTKEVTINERMLSIDKPIVGYFGSLTQANDKDIIIAIAKKGVSVVLIGDVFGNYQECLEYKNIHFIKAVPYDVLPTYAKYFDIGILAWKPAQWINNCNPKKTYEYLSLGLPIVSVRIPQLEYELGDYIVFADTPDEFAEKVMEEIKNDSLEKKRKRIERARSESWENKFVQLNKILDQYVR